MRSLVLGSRRAALALLLVAGACSSGGGGDHQAEEADRSDASADAPSLSREQAEAIDEVVEGAVDQGDPGCALAVGLDGEVLFAEGYGDAEADGDEPLSDETTFDIASVSKQFTAAAVLLLVDDGDLALDESIDDLIPELPDYTFDVTIDDLVHHTSGIPDYVELLSEDFSYEELTTTEDALEALAAEPILTAEPGTTFEYSNSNYFLLGEVVHRVSGEPLAGFLEDEVFEPLGMDHTVVRDDADLDIPDAATGHVPAGDGFEASGSDWEQVGDGAIWTDVRDLTAWAGNLVDWEVGGDALEAAMTEPGPVPDEDGYDYGGGLVLDGDELSHDGAWAGFLSDFRVDRESGMSVVVLCNQEEVDPTELGDEVVAIVDA